MMGRIGIVVALASVALLSIASIACSSERSSAFGPSDAGGVADGGDASGSSGSSGSFGSVDAGPLEGTPVRSIPGLKSITYYETSGVVNSYEFLVDGPEMTAKIATLSEAAHDIKGVDTEYYDVYYSDEAGSFDIDGKYLTIAGTFAHALPAGGGLNLAEISLNYEGKPAEYGNYVASFVALGDNAAAGSEQLAIDGKIETCSTMGNTTADPGKLLRITLGFASSSGPPR
jgi:hypothetical protein